MATRICQLKKTYLLEEKVLGQDIVAIQLKINSVLDIGRAKRGKMTVKEMLALLEKHEEECNRRYAKIEKGLEKLDMRMWGIAALIVGAAILEKIFA